ncbi:cell division ATP-binding protein FtsE [Gemmatimonadota bacterium]
MYNVSKRYETLEVLNEVTLQIDRGDFVCLTGRTGSGKSTLMRLIYMEERPTSGQVIVEGYSSDQIKRREIPHLRRKIGVLFQDFKLLRERTAYENVSFALHVIGRPQREIRKSVVRALTKVGLGHKRDSFPHELSGGEQQRVALARALVNEPILLLADEPTGNLDLEVGKGIVDLFQQVNYQGTAILMATHNLPLMENLQTRRIHLADGRLTGETGGEMS